MGISAMFMHTWFSGQRARHIAAFLQEGDLIFISCGTGLFRRISGATGCWANHVGLLFRSPKTGQWEVSESAIPFARKAPLALFLSRGGRRQVAVVRRRKPLTSSEVRALREAALERMGRHYDFSFNYDGPGQFCSKFAHDCYLAATDQPLGRIQSFSQLREARPDHPLGPWRLWFLGNIPWSQRTVTPASLLHSDAVRLVLHLASGSVLPTGCDSVLSPGSSCGLVV